MTIVNNLFVITLASAVIDNVFKYTGNVGNFLGSTNQAVTVLTKSMFEVFEDQVR